MSFTILQEIRLAVGDTDPVFPLLTDSEYEYFLEKNNNSLRLASLAAARTILLKLSINSVDETVSVFSMKGSQAAKAYMDALKFFIKEQAMNPLAVYGEVYAGGISKTDYLANNSNPDNVVPDIKPTEYQPMESQPNTYSNPFMI